MRKNLSLALVFLMLFGNIPTGLVEEESQPVEQATEIVYEVEESPAESEEAPVENTSLAESASAEPAEESLSQAAASTNTAASSTGTAASAHAETEAQEAVCICSADLHCCDVIALFEAGELPEDTELCPVCIIEVNGKLQLNEEQCECCKDYCKQKAAESTADSGEGEAPSTEAEGDASASKQVETSETQADVSPASGESAETSPESAVESSEEATEEATEETAEESAEETTEQSTASASASTASSSSSGTSSTKSSRSSGKRSSSTKRSSSSKGAGKVKASAAAAEGEAQGAEGRAGSSTTWYQYQDFVDLDSLLLASQTESESSSLYIGKDFLLSNLENTLLLSEDAALLETLASNAQGEVEGLLLESEGEESSPMVVYMLAEEEGVELEHKFYTSQLAEDEAIIEEALPEGTLAKLLLAEDYLYLQNAEQVYVVARTEEALASLQAQDGFAKALFLLLDQEVLEGSKYLQVQITSSETNIETSAKSTESTEVSAKDAD